MGTFAFRSVSGCGNSNGDTHGDVCIHASECTLVMVPPPLSFVNKLFFSYCKNVTHPVNKKAHPNESCLSITNMIALNVTQLLLLACCTVKHAICDSANQMTPLPFMLLKQCVDWLESYTAWCKPLYLVPIHRAMTVWTPQLEEHEQPVAELDKQCIGLESQTKPLMLHNSVLYIHPALALRLARL